MAKLTLTKSAVDAAHPQAKAVELRDTLVPGFLCKITQRAARCSCSITAPTRASAASPPWASMGN